MCLSEMDPWEAPSGGGEGDDESAMHMSLRRCKTSH